MPNGNPVLLGQNNTETLEANVENSGAGNALTGFASAGTGNSLNGVFGRASNPDASGVYGEHRNGGYGVAGRAMGPRPVRPGVYGENVGEGPGVHGNSASGTGVRGETNTGLVGVSGESRRGPGSFEPFVAAGIGVQGKGAVGVSGLGDGGALGGGMIGEGTGVTTGVIGSSIDGEGVHGEAVNGVGVAGVSSGNHGVTGTSQSAFGVRGASTVGTGVFGFSPGRNGVHGMSSHPGGSGVLGEAADPNAFAIQGRGSGQAGLFQGRVEVTGLLVKTGGGFRIDHPLDLENKYLQHSFVESPDMMNVYNGNVTTDADGDATVVLPGYCEILNRDFRYQLTPIGQFAQTIVASKIEGNHFRIKTDKPNVEVSWQVTGIRQDDWANAHRVQVEEEKSDDHRGKFLTPLEHDRPETNGVYYEAPSPIPTGQDS